MKLRWQLALVSLCMLVLPWSGWRLLREMEDQLRRGQEQVQAASAEAIARSLSAQRGLLPPPAPRWYVQPLPRTPRLDADFSDWAGVETQAFPAAAAAWLELAVARDDSTSYLRIEVHDPTPQRGDAHWPKAATLDHVRLQLEGRHGRVDLRLANARSGALIATAVDGSPASLRLDGEWRDRGEQGYRIELRLPPGWPLTALGVQAFDADALGGQRWAGSGADPPLARWPLWQPGERVGQRLQALLPEGTRARLIDSEGWVYADQGELPPAGVDDPLPWWKRQLWYALAFAEQPYSADGDRLGRLDLAEVWQAMSGLAASQWRRDRQAPRLLLSSAVPLFDGAEQRAVLWLQSEQQTLLLADRALTGLLGGSLLALLIVLAVLLAFAAQLSRRIRRLRDAVEAALNSDGAGLSLTASRAGDEIGDLSRSFARLLGEVGASQAYLRSLAGKLSHELNTPLAVVRGALDNVDAEHLGELDRRCLQRAQSGSERLSRIVRAMSEASRMEQAVASAEAEDVELVALLRQLAEGYRPLLAARELQLQLPEPPLWLHGSAELIVQALDKLLDNARSFTPESGWVRIGLQRTTDGVLLTVANQGPPLPAQIRDRLFESLVGDRSGPSSEGVHLGFGLYVVRLVAERHGGSASAADLADASGVEFALRLRRMPRR